MSEIDKIKAQVERLFFTKDTPLKLNQVIEFKLRKKTLRGVVYEIGYMDAFANVKVSGKKYFIKRVGNVGVRWECVNEINNLSKSSNLKLNNK
jgi:uncharacterized protein YajQ (UPF0234 family)